MLTLPACRVLLQVRAEPERDRVVRAECDHARRHHDHLHGHHHAHRVPGALLRARPKVLRSPATLLHSRVGGACSCLHMLEAVLYLNRTPKCRTN